MIGNATKLANSLIYHDAMTIDERRDLILCPPKIFYRFNQRAGKTVQWVPELDISGQKERKKRLPKQDERQPRSERILRRDESRDFHTSVWTASSSLEEDLKRIHTSSNQVSSISSSFADKSMQNPSKGSGMKRCSIHTGWLESMLMSSFPQSRCDGACSMEATTRSKLLEVIVSPEKND